MTHNETPIMNRFVTYSVFLVRKFTLEAMS